MSFLNLQWLDQSSHLPLFRRTATVNDFAHNNLGTRDACIVYSEADA